MLEFLKGIVEVHQWLKELTAHKVTVKLLSPENNREVSEFIDLYKRRIDPSQQIETQHIIEWLQDKRIRKRLKNRIFIAKYESRIIGFLQVMMPGTHPYAFASYFAVDDTQLHGRVHAAEALVFDTMLYVESKAHKSVLVFEVEKPSLKEEATKRKSDLARIRMFKGLFARFGHIAYQIDAPYVQPEMPNDGGSFNKHEMLLMYAASSTLSSNSITKLQYEEIVSFIYDDIYSAVFEYDDDLSTIYKSELNELKFAILSECQEVIRLI